MLTRAKQQRVNEILEEIKASVVEESEWQKKWPKMLQGLSDL